MECRYPNLLETWLAVNAFDEYAFTPITFAKEMARRGHRVIAVLGTYDLSRNTVQDGVEFICVKGEYPSVTADLILFSSWPDIGLKCLKSGGWKARQIAWRVRGFGPELWTADRINCLSQIDLLLTAAASDVRYFAPYCRRVEWLPSGVNVEAIQHYHGERIYDVATASCSPAKGDWFAGLVLEEARRQGGIAPQNISGKSKAELWSLLGQSKVFFYPSAVEGHSRLMSEAAAAGCLVAVASGSPSCVEHAQEIGGVVIDIPIDYTPIPLDYKPGDPLSVIYKTSADPARVAAQLLKLPYRPCRVPSNLYGSFEVKVLCAYAEELMG